MAENEAFMEAIREDVMAGEEEAQYERERLQQEYAMGKRMQQKHDGDENDSDN
jgi:hypothetical protein